MENKDNMYHTCRWCKHYENGCCTNENNFDWDTEDDDIPEHINLIVKEPESFYCKEWE